MLTQVTVTHGADRRRNDIPRPTSDRAIGRGCCRYSFKSRQSDRLWGCLTDYGVACCAAHQLGDVRSQIDLSVHGGPPSFEAQNCLLDSE